MEYYKKKHKDLKDQEAVTYMLGGEPLSFIYMALSPKLYHGKIKGHHHVLLRTLVMWGF